MDLDNFSRLALNTSLWDLEPGLVVNGRTNAEIARALDSEADRAYLPCVQAGSALDEPVGNIVSFLGFESRGVYPRTVRDVWIYKPPIEKNQMHLAVFQDGESYLDPRGAVRATAVIESMILSGDLEPTVAVFVGAGRPLDGEAEDAPLARQRQRSVEYDTCDDTYVRFLTDEVLPLVSAEGGDISADPSHRMIAGISSGGICAFNAAWHAPEVFGRVLSHCGSFTNIRGGHNYPYLVRTTPHKPIRVMLQSGALDADILYGNWPLANQQMASALVFAGYDYRFEYGHGGHSLRHGGSLFAESLQWLFAE